MRWSVCMGLEKIKLTDAPDGIPLIVFFSFWFATSTTIISCLYFKRIQKDCILLLLLTTYPS